MITSIVHLRRNWWPALNTALAGSRVEVHDWERLPAGSGPGPATDASEAHANAASAEMPAGPATEAMRRAAQSAPTAPVEPALTARNATTGTVALR